MNRKELADFRKEAREESGEALPEQEVDAKKKGQGSNDPRHLLKARLAEDLIKNSRFKIEIIGYVNAGIDAESPEVVRKLQRRYADAEVADNYYEKLMMYNKNKYDPLVEKLLKVDAVIRLDLMFDLVPKALQNPGMKTNMFEFLVNHLDAYVIPDYRHLDLLEALPTEDNKTFLKECWKWLLGRERKPSH